MLCARFDQPKPTPDFHLDLWKLCCSKHPRVAIAAPRGHAKSTAVTHSYVLANVLFRNRSHVLIISDTEGQAKGFLGDIKMELLENEMLRKEFQVNELVKDTETEIVVSLGSDGHLFRIITKGSEQKLRGLKWRGKRPDLIVCDDLENDEIVANPERREKFRKWFLGALLPCGADGAIFRVVGTILHFDSMLERLLNDTAWKTMRFGAHNEDFSEILWPEKFSKTDLEAIRAMYIAQGEPDTYAQEYLNIPISGSHSYFKKSDFLPIENPKEELNYYMACDLALTKHSRSDYCAFVVGGVNSEGILKIVNVVRDRMDTYEAVQTIFRLYKNYTPQLVAIEGGVISKAIMPLFRAEMLRRGIFIPIKECPPTQDKRLRAQPIRARMRQHAVQFDTAAEWYPDFQAELLVFDKGKNDDQVDALAWLGQVVDKMNDAPTVEELSEEKYQDMINEYELNDLVLGMDMDCGY